MNTDGVLPMQDIKKLIEDGFIFNVDKSNINPASLDLSASEERYRIDSVFLPRNGEKIRDIIEALGKREHDINQPLEKGVIYIIKIKEVFKLPAHVQGNCNPKSSTGRHDVHVRVVCDGVPRYDRVPDGFTGEVWSIVVPRSYPVLMPKDFRITQIRIFSGERLLRRKGIEEMWQNNPLMYSLGGQSYEYSSLNIKSEDDSLLMTLDLSQDIVGYESLETGKILDLSAPNASIDHKDYYRPIYKTGDSLLLKKDRFYILSTREALRITPNHSVEMSDIDSVTGEFRTHYAGFFDPGWGYEKSGEGKGRPMTLEVRAFEDVLINEGQTIGKIYLEKMSAEPIRHYDEVSSNYLKQSGPKLAKQFK